MGWKMDAIAYRELVERQGSIRPDVGRRLAATIISEDDPTQSWRPDERMVFGYEGVPVEGLGASAEVIWNGRAHVISRLGWRSSLSINGQVVDSHVLVSGDRFQVGKSRFRYELACAARVARTSVCVISRRDPGSIIVGTRRPCPTCNESRMTPCLRSRTTTGSARPICTPPWR